ncbi:hypothetical protein CR969_02165 [Candidatus Saccharibacteria bacterium]|nr:MAG: hypothetical protein CR969_02165 [Candidatus Saccharibacteria bacterium]
MTLLSKQYLASLGLDLSDEDAKSLSDHAEDTLQKRVVDEVLDVITPEQAHQLAKLQSENDDELVQKWLVDNVEDLQDIISDEVDILLGEIAEDSQNL